MQKIMYIIKKLVMAFCLLYSFNVIISPANVLIPINVFSILVASFLGIPGIFGILFLMYML